VPLKPFISYAHEDEAFKDALLEHLAGLQRRGLIQPWHDRLIEVGSEWRESIGTSLNGFDLALLLVSRAFLASDFIHSVEIKHLLERRKREGIRVVPIIVRPCAWKLEPIGELQALPGNGKAIISFPEETGERDQAWTAIALQLAQWAEELQSRKPSITDPVTAQEPAKARGDFKARLGDAKNPGLLPPVERLERIRPGENPYVTGTPLPANSPGFFGRVQVLHEILAVLHRPDKPGCVSLLGERRIGKSSLLNQICQALAPVPGLVSIHTTAQDWNRESQQHFYTCLHQAIATAVGKGANEAISDYPRFRDFIYALGQDHGYRFVLVIDEFEEMADNEYFDAGFFSNLRALGERPEYRFGFLTSSRRPLKELCQDHDIESSSFWNIFGIPQILGLLSEQESQDLVIEPMHRSRPAGSRPDPSQLWQTEIKPLTGCHPALIQMVAEVHWNALEGGYEPDRWGLTMGVRDYLEDLWFRHSREEWAVLIRAAAGQRLTVHDPLATDLIRRGLLAPNGEPFSSAFKEVIAQCLPKDSDIPSALEDLEKGAERANRLFESLEKRARSAGRVYRAFKSPDKDGGEELDV